MSEPKKIRIVIDSPQAKALCDTHGLDTETVYDCIQQDRQRGDLSKVVYIKNPTHNPKIMPPKTTQYIALAKTEYAVVE